MPSQPWKRSSRAMEVQQRSPSTWRSSWSPPSFRAPQAKQLCGSTSIRSSGVVVSAGAFVPRFDRRSTASVEPPSRTRRSDVKVPDLPGLGLDELLAWRDLLAHQHREDRVGLFRVLDLGAEERPRLRVHRRLPELIGVHLAEALEALDRHVLAVHLLDDPVPLLLALRVASHLPGRDAIERRLGDVEVAVLDHLRHEPIE